MRKIFLKIHLWLSVPFGLMITLICFSGAMLVFEDEISEAADRDMYFTSVPEDSRNKVITVDNAASVSYGRPGNRRAADRYAFDTTSGEMTGSALYKDASRASKVSGWVYSVHTGSWGGILTKVLTFIAALLGASLPLTGYWMWLKRRLISHH